MEIGWAWLYLAGGGVNCDESVYALLNRYPVIDVPFITVIRVYCVMFCKCQSKFMLGFYH